MLDLGDSSYQFGDLSRPGMTVATSSDARGSRALGKEFCGQARRAVGGPRGLKRRMLRDLVGGLCGVVALNAADRSGLINAVCPAIMLDVIEGDLAELSVFS